MKSLCAVCLLVASPSPGLDAGLLQYIPSDAKNVVGLHVDRAIASPLGSYLQRLAGPDSRELRGFVVLTGFDPRRDVREALFVSGGTDGLVIARGTFNASQIAAAAAISGTPSQTHGGTGLFQTLRNGTWVAFPETGIALIGQQEMVKAAIDSRTGGSLLDEQLSQKMSAVSSRFDVWFAAKGQPGMKLAKAKLPEDSLQIVSGGLTLGAVVKLDAEAVMRSEQDARSVLELVKFLAGIAKLQQNRNPEMVRLLDLVQKADTRVEGTTVHFSTSVPETDIEQFIGGRTKVAALQ